MKHLSVSLKNKLEEIPILAQAIEKFAEVNNLADQSVFQVNLCLDELLTNTISYGFPEGGQHEIKVEIALQGGMLVIATEDDGLAFNPLERPAPDTSQGIEERAIGGLGIHLVRNMMDEIEYQRKEEHNVLVMKKQIKYL